MSDDSKYITLDTDEEGIWLIYEGEQSPEQMGCVTWSDVWYWLDLHRKCSEENLMRDSDD